MSHISTSRKAGKSTPKQWLQAGAQLGEVVNKWSKRGDLVTLVGPKAGSGAPACYKPPIAEIEINTDVCFGELVKPRMIPDLTVRRNQFDYPVGMGAVLHEAMHAKHTRFDLSAFAKEKDPRIPWLIMLFEESRIEARGVVTMPENRSWLRACALTIVLADLKEEKSEEEKKLVNNGALAMTQLTLLSLARVDAGVLEDEDVEKVQEEIGKVFDKKLLRRLRNIWLKAQRWSHDADVSGLRQCADEWLKELEDAGHDTKPEGMGAPGDADGEGSGSGIPSEVLEAIMDAIAEAADEAETRATTEGYEQVTHEEMKAVAEQNAKAMAEHKEHQDAAKEVFGKDTGPLPYSATRSHLVEKRAPTAAERQAAVLIGNKLDQARYRDRVTTTYPSELPPGRLRSGAAVHGAAQRHLGIPPTAEPFDRKMRRMVEDPTLKLGVMVDISGSMNAAMEPMASTAWIFSEAARRIQAKCAMIYYGNSIFPTLRPGQHLEQVQIYAANDGTEYFDPAFKALNGVLGLCGPEASGARMLVIVSDLIHTNAQTKAAKHWIKKCLREGVGVLIIPYSDSPYYNDYRDPYKKLGATVLEDILGPAAAAMTIGEACVKQLEKAGTTQVG